jgi:predicted RND superfamily exporter protein
MTLGDALSTAALAVLILLVIAYRVLTPPAAQLTVGGLAFGVTAAVCVSLGIAVYTGQI